MNADNIFDVLGGLVFVAALTTVVTSRYTAGQITAAGNAVGGIFQAALGKGSIRR
jgi:hypothetical protein